jgi:hypothetical protein
MCIQPLPHCVPSEALRNKTQVAWSGIGICVCVICWTPSREVVGLEVFTAVTMNSTVLWKEPDVSEERITSFFRVE